MHVLCNDFVRLLNASFIKNSVFLLFNASDGTCNISGLDRFEARKKLWFDLEETGLAVRKESHTLRVPRSQRGGEVRLCCFLFISSKFGS